MPDQRPSNASTDLPAKPGDDAHAASVLIESEDAPGGGGLGGGDAGNPLAQPSGAASRNSPIDALVPGAYIASPTGKAASEAARTAVATPATEPPPESL